MIVCLPTAGVHFNLEMIPSQRQSFPLYVMFVKVDVAPL